MERDLTWDAIVGVAERMSTKYGVTVKARRTRGWQVHEGLAVPDRDVFEIVRTRRAFSDRWDDRQPVEVAANAVGERLRPGTDQRR